MNIVDYFDPQNIDHLKAYRHLEEHGVWKQGFIPDIKDMDFPNGWQISILQKIATAWLNYKITKE